MSKILQTPIINTIIPFDPTYDQVITFSYEDNQAVRNRIIIKNNENGAIITERTQEGMALQHTIPSKILVAGEQYTIQVQVFDADGNQSNFSDAVLFYCFTTPELSFANIQNDEPHKNASISLDLSYVQTEGEPIRSFQFMQYSFDKTLISSSEVFYSQSPMSYSFYNLENDSVYFFRATGETQHGMALDTGYVEVKVEYKQLPMIVAFDIENDYCNGVISISLNIRDVEYELGNNNYILDNDKVVLMDNYLKYFNFEVDDDFSLYIKAKKVKVGKFFTTNDDNASLSIISVCGDYYCELSVANSDLKQYVLLPKAKLDTNFQSRLSIIDVSPEDDDTVIFEIKRENGLYGLEIYNESEL